MSVEVAIVEGALGDAHRAAWWPGHGQGAGLAGGAFLSFDGVVRQSEGEGVIAALAYEAYEPMASRQLLVIGERVVAGRGLLALACWHSVGRVLVGESSLRVQLAGVHRGEVIGGLAEFIDALKRDVPIWKHAVWAE